MRALGVLSATLLFASGCSVLGYDGRCVGPRSQYRYLTTSGYLPYDSIVRDSANPGEFFGTFQVQLQEYRPDTILGRFVVFTHVPPDGGRLRGHVLRSHLEDSKGMLGELGTTPGGSDSFFGSPPASIRDQAVLDRARAAFLNGGAVIVFQTDLPGYEHLRSPLGLTDAVDWTWYRCD
jgi:hypothetical protein